jgi:hypothetical protein
MPPKKSPVWQHFEEDASDHTNVLCKVPGCKKSKVSRGKEGTSKGNLSNAAMTNHLKNNHPRVYTDFMKAKTAKDSADKRKLDEEKEENEMEGGTVPLFNLNTLKKRREFLQQTSLNSWVGATSVQGQGSVYDVHDIRAKERHKGVLMMVVVDLQPWNFVSDPGFIYYSNQMDPHYKVASTTFYRELLDKAHKNGVNKVQDKLKRDDPVAISCQLDGWSSYRHGYLGMLVNYISPAWKRVSLCLACSPYDDHHTGDNIGNWLEEKLSTWKVLDKTTVVVSDTASNMLRMMEFLPNDMKHNDCLNHVLQLAINDEVFVKPEVTNIVANVKAFVNYCSHSVLLSESLRKKQVDLGYSSIKALVQDVRTRWNSTHDMLERFFELKEAIIQVLEDEEWKGKISVKATGGKVKFTINDWRVMERTVQVLKPFKEATVKLSFKSACISEAIPTLTSIRHTLRLASTSADKGVRDLKSRLNDNLEARTGYLELSDMHTISTLLDWR